MNLLPIPSLHNVTLIKCFFVIDGCGFNQKPSKESCHFIAQINGSLWQHVSQVVGCLKIMSYLICSF